MPQAIIPFSRYFPLSRAPLYVIKVACCALAVTCGMCWPVEASPDLGALREAVEALPEGTSQERLKKDVLFWSLAKAEAVGEGGFSGKSTAILESVEGSLDEPIGTPQTGDLQIIPSIRFQENNPYWDLLAGVITAGGGRLDRLSTKAWAFSFPESDLFMDGATGTKVFDELDGFFSVSPESYTDINLLIFACAQALDAFRQTDYTYPGLILAPIREEWLLGAKAHLDRIYAIRGNPTNNPRIHGTNYPNPDAHALLAMNLAGNYFSDPEYADFETRLLQGLEDHLYPDGGWSYLFESNEEPAYHAVTLRALLRYWELTGSPDALGIIKGTVPYYGLSTELGGVAEGSTSPYWKHRWDMVLPWYVGAVGAIADDAGNHSHGLDLMEFNAAAGANYLGGTFRFLDADILRIAASWFNPGQERVSAKDNYVIYDWNIEGPRGRFGKWSFNATGRDLERDRGKYTFAGAMLVDPDEGLYPLDSALQVAASRIYTDPEEQSFMLGMNDRNSMTMGETFATFVTKYQLQEPVVSGGFSIALPWDGVQQWIMTPDRIVGYVSINAQGTQEAYGVEGVIRVGSGRGLPLLKFQTRSLNHLGGGAFRFGDMRITLHDHNYSQVTTDAEPFPAYRGNSADILLLDPVKVSGSGPQAYPLEERPSGQFYLFEARPEEASAALAVEHWSSSGLEMLYLKSRENEQYLVIHNQQDSAIPFQFSEANLPDSFEEPFQYFLGMAETGILKIDGSAIIIPPGEQLTLASGTPVDWSLSTDGDTLPDAWEIQYIGSKALTDEHDPDGDGISNFREMIMGTDPLRRTPPLQPELQYAENRLNLSFSSNLSALVGFSRVYDIEKNEALSANGWRLFIPDIPATGGILSHEIPVEPRMFYRIGVKLVEDEFVPKF